MFTFVAVLIGLLILAIVIIGFLIYFLVRKRKNKIDDYNESIVIREETLEKNKEVRINEKNKIDNVVSSDDVMDTFNDIMRND